VPQIYPERLNGFAPNSQGRRVWSLARTSLNVKVDGQRSRSPGTKNALSAAVTSRQRTNGMRSLQTECAAVDGTIAPLLGGDFVVLRAVCIW